MCALPTGKQESDFTAIEPGNYQAKLKRITLGIETEYESKSFNDGDGLAYQGCTLVWDVDGEEYHDKFVKVSLHEQAKLYNRVSALLGRALTETDSVEWKVNAKAETNWALDQYYKASKDDPEAGITKGQYVVTGEPKYEGIEGLVDDLLVNGESLIGRECLLNIEKNKKGYNRTDGSAATPLPKGRGQRAAAPAPTEGDEEKVEAAPAKGRRRAASASEEEGEAPTEPPRRRRQAPAGAPT